MHSAVLGESYNTREQWWLAASLLNGCCICWWPACSIQSTTHGTCSNCNKVYCCTWLVSCCLPVCVHRQLKYETGDHVGMYARNSDKVVATAAQLLGLALDTTFKLHADGEEAK